jgi:hypothetical protein
VDVCGPGRQAGLTAKVASRWLSRVSAGRARQPGVEQRLDGVAQSGMDDWSSHREQSRVLEHRRQEVMAGPDFLPELRGRIDRGVDVATQTGLGPGQRVCHGGEGDVPIWTRLRIRTTM